MAEWNKNKVEPSAINSGREFTKNDNLLVNELNAIVNNSFFASEKAQRAEELAESAVEGQGTPVTLNGEVLPTWSADFVEAERQKSKNLFNITNTQNTNTITSYSDHIVLNGTPSATPEYPYKSSKVPNGIKFTKGETYTFSRQLISGDGSLNFKLGFVLQDKSGNALKEVVIPSGQNSATFTINSDDIENYSCYLEFVGGTTFTNAYYGLQLEKSSVATDYQPYNGAIVHEKEIANVEHTDVLFDVTSGKVVIGGQIYAVGIQGGNIVQNLDLSKYDYLDYVVVFPNGIEMTLRMNLKGYPQNYWVMGRCGTEDMNGSFPVNNVYLASIKVNKEKTSISYENTGFFTSETNTYTDRNGHDLYSIIRIIGGYLK